MKWHHNLVEIAFRNYNSYVYHDTFLKFRLYDELAKVSSRDPRTSSLLDPQVQNPDRIFSDQSGKL